MTFKIFIGMAVVCFLSAILVLIGQLGGKPECVRGSAPDITTNCGANK